jgi:hypothetical protein
MKEETKLGIVTAVLIMALAIFFKNVIHKPSDVISLFLIPMYLFIGYITGKAGAKVWISATLSITITLAAFYTFF